MLCLLILLAACNPAASPGVAGKPDAAAVARALPLADEARRRLQQGDAAGALQQLQTALKADRSLPAVHQLLGQVHWTLGDVVAAAAAYTDALRLGADRNEVVLPLAAALIAQGQPQALLDQTRLDDAGLVPHVRGPLLLMKAEAAAELAQDQSPGQGPGTAALRHIAAARALDSTHPASWLAEARLHLRSGQPEQAAAAADKALSLAATSATALATRADVALAMGNRAAALEMYGRAITAEPASPAAHEARMVQAGLQLETSTDQPLSPAAVNAIEQLAKTHPGDPRTKFLAALLAQRQGRAQDAQQALAAVAQTLLRVPPEALRNRPQLLMMGALAHLGLGETDNARVHLLAAQVTPASAAPASRLLALSYLADNNLERAITVLEAHLQKRPADQQALLMLAGTQLALGRHTKAINLLQDTLARQDSPAVRGMLAAGHTSTGGLLPAQTELALALKATPAHSGLLAASYALQLHSGQPAKAVLSAQTLVQREPHKAAWHHLLGVAHMRNSQPVAARTAFAAANGLDASFTAPRVALARLEASNGGMAAAQSLLQAVLTQQPQHADALFEMGRLSLQRQELAAAQDWFEKAQAAASSDNTQATLALLDLHLSQRRLPAAASVLRPLVQRQPDNLLVLLAQARLALANNDSAAARTLLTRATGLAGYEAGALVQVALLQLQATPLQQADAGLSASPSASAPVAAPTATAAPAGSLQDPHAGAQHALEKALADNPNLLAAQALMVDVELRQREFDRAQARVQQLLATHPRLALVQALQGDVALARGQLAPALAAYRRAQQMEPSAAHLLKVQRTLAQTDAAAANTLASQWLQQHPSDHAVRRALADGQARLGQYAAARVSYETIVQAVPGDAEALNNLAHVLLLLQDASAPAVAEKALQAQPNAAHIMATAGWANVMAGKTERGMNWLRDARLRDPDNGDARYFMAAAMARQGRTAEARTEARAALDGVARGRPMVHAADAQRLLESLP